ncbi:F-box/LRR-repeat/kelch-repeat protein At1g09650 [Eutrema salsugineum]|uniref:F-box/LRR-repeat/kelch-repeat protein At1g09650 n=1 Tax=Eutrema salsugineum TaxID=72664 RepID=UPI000CED7A3D|nr:F-box/LRR-repeat/kelch-repeat protein At1g09650 [Eutrema salsugineum]
MTRSCDGLVCVYDFQKELYVINPATRWCRSLPRAKFQQINRIRENLNIKGETKIVYFDLHTEVFHVMSEIPIAHASPSRIIMWSLNNRLCVLEKKINSQVIWSLNSHNVWEKTYSITLNQSCANL